MRRRLHTIGDRWRIARDDIRAIHLADSDEAECVLVALRETGLPPTDIADQLRRHGGLVANIHQCISDTELMTTERDKAQAERDRLQAEVDTLQARKDAMEAEITTAVETAARQASHGFASLVGRMESAVRRAEAAVKTAQEAAAFTQAGADQIINAVTENAERNGAVLREDRREVIAAFRDILAERDATLLRAVELGLLVEGVDGNPDIDRPAAALRLLEKEAPTDLRSRNHLSAARRELTSLAEANSQNRAKAAERAAGEARRDGTTAAPAIVR